MTTLPRGLAAAATLLVLASTTACSGGSGDSGEGGDVTTSITDSSASTSPTAPAAGDDTATADPGGDTTTYTVDRAGISFALPADWTGLDAAALQEQLTASGTADDAAERLGITPEQLQQLVASDVVFYATAPTEIADFRGNLNVLVIEDQKLDQAAIEAQYRAVGATDIASTDVSTDAGDGFVTTYVLQAGAITAYGEAVVLDLGGQVAVLTVSTGERSASASIGAGLVTSLTRA